MDGVCVCVCVCVCVLTFLHGLNSVRHNQEQSRILPAAGAHIERGGKVQHRCPRNSVQGSEAGPQVCGCLEPSWGVLLEERRHDWC